MKNLNLSVVEDQNITNGIPSFDIHSELYGIVAHVYNERRDSKKLAQLFAAAPGLFTVLKDGLECGVFDDAPVFREDAVKALEAAGYRK